MHTIDKRVVNFGSIVLRRAFLLRGHIFDSVRGVGMSDSMALASVAEAVALLEVGVSKRKLRVYQNQLLQLHIQG